MEHNISLLLNNISCDVISAMVYPVPLYIPVLLSWLALHVMEDGWLAASEGGVSVENMEQQYIHKEWCSAVLQQMKRSVRTQALKLLT